MGQRQEQPFRREDFESISNELLWIANKVAQGKEELLSGLYPVFDRIRYCTTMMLMSTITSTTRAAAAAVVVGGCSATSRTIGIGRRRYCASASSNPRHCRSRHPRRRVLSPSRLPSSSSSSSSGVWSHRFFSETGYAGRRSIIDDDNDIDDDDDDAGGVDITASRYGNSSSSATTLRGLPLRYLRSIDSANYDSSTGQRSDVPFDRDTGKPPAVELPPTATSTADAASTPTQRPKNKKYAIEKHSYDGQTGVHRVEWGDGFVSEYGDEFLRRHWKKWSGESLVSDRVLWTGWTEQDLRCNSISNSLEASMRFSDVVSSDSDGGMDRALRSLYRYGILLVTETPVRDGGVGVAALGSALGGGTNKNSTTILHHYRRKKKNKNSNVDDLPIMLRRGTDGPLRTLYGTVWSTTSSGQVEGSSVADSAYGQEGLPLHTDMTYHRDPPGLQIFTMVQPALRGGESVFADGFAAAEQLRMEDPNAFETLSTVIRRYRSIDYKTGWHLEASGPVISQYNDRVVAIRHNDLDQYPDLPPTRSTPEEIEEFYYNLDHAHDAWNRVLSRDDLRLEVSLREGDTVIIANQVRNVSSRIGLLLLRVYPRRNFSHTITLRSISVLPQRCFHARRSFQARADHPRLVMGCYVSQDELNSRFRMAGYDVY